MKNKSRWDRFWRDKNGDVSIIEVPNIPLALAAIFLVLSKVFSRGQLHIAAEYIYFGFLFTWAWLELTTGKSYFRRVLGTVVLVAIIYSRLH